MFPFPRTEPPIRMSDLPGQEMTIRCLDEPATFFEAKLGVSSEFGFYDYAPTGAGERVFTGAHLVRTTRRVSVDRFTLLEVEAYYADAGQDYAGRPACWNQVLEEGGVTTEVVVELPGGEPWRYRPGSRTPLPTELYVGMRAQGCEPVFSTGTAPEQLTSWHLEVIGAVEVMIGPKPYRCLRGYSVWEPADAAPYSPALLEWFTAESGRTILCRRFNGLGAKNYNDLAAHETLVYQDMHWRHWYDTIPDHALIIGA